MKHPRNSPPSTPVRVSTSIHAFLLEYLRHQPYFKEWWKVFYKVFQMYHSIWMTSLLQERSRDHLAILEKIFSRLQNAGIRLKRSKCAFMLSSNDYLGHRISADGLKPTKEKVRAISEASAPLNVTQLRSFLGVVNYYSKFLLNLSPW